MITKKGLYAFLIIDIIAIILISIHLGKDFLFNPPFSKISDEKITIPDSTSKPGSRTPIEKKLPAPPVMEKKDPADKATRKIMFQYRNSVPREVSVMGEFSDWEPISMTKGKNHTWTVSVEIAPGSYLYCYNVDGNLKPDPNNPNLQILPGNEKRSQLTVKPLP